MIRLQFPEESDLLIISGLFKFFVFLNNNKYKSNSIEQPLLPEMKTVLDTFSCCK